MRYLLFILIIGSFLACRETPETGERGTGSASPYTAGADSTAREDGLEGTHSGTELEAPRLIPALRNQLELMSAGAEIREDNLMAYKNLAQDVINSMVADMQRVGYADSGAFRALKDSVLNEIGRGASSEPDLDPSQVPGHVERMRRLIEMYQQAMRGAADKL
jgi:hypothetical protein